jgi:raffinose/stachyose/melibiose transport system substrate-binding protein
MTVPAIGQFAQGQGLMYANVSSVRGTVDAASPPFGYHYHPLPIGGAPNGSPTVVTPSVTFSVNAHASAPDQAAAQIFVDFLARPKQAALYGQLTGGLSQYDFLHAQLPAFMSSDFASVVKQSRYVLNPGSIWWNANVLLALQQYGIGLITGQSSVDDVLNAMDAAWKQGPA